MMKNQSKHLNALNQVATNMVTKLFSDMNMLQRKSFRQYTLSKTICTFLYKAACSKVTTIYLNENQTF